MIDEDFVVKLADFGLAVQRRGAGLMDSIKGTPNYFCPEIIRRQPYGPKADTWALGCVLYQMATLRPPFTGANLLALSAKIDGAKFDMDALEGRSTLLRMTVCALIEPNSDARADVRELSSIIAPVLVDQLGRHVAYVQTLRSRVVTERANEQRRTRDLRDRENYLSVLHGGIESSTDSVGSSAFGRRSSSDGVALAAPSTTPTGGRSAGALSVGSPESRSATPGGPLGSSPRAPSRGRKPGRTKKRKEGRGGGVCGEGGA